ncbi:probable pirin [Cyanidioschyzon merolae strain 10D]|uniref:Probable pirin n=1 Tax=Cyanidioschyzon merolae (strain NIES-3377 / 10D) TaxID=280699 RepID=M1VGQ3_CYAM1|nr:probable pirin [Cyanidioschyzon merolae strain 10D]BAM82367.1 probable pirin [Cyanidioschyzon merolae strain 10D]|eukprot:XP_005538403.1 probable pirin [Cyanidioschyzon merolae strain 10D]
MKIAFICLLFANKRSWATLRQHPGHQSRAHSLLRAVTGIRCMSSVEKPRVLERVVAAREQQDGVGARVRRSIGTPSLGRLDPFLLLDHFHVKPPGGFPDHPHRGFQTVTYMLKGKFRHRDNRGHEGVIEAGDLQWMTAGGGIVHSEMPATPDENEGLQIWVNLAAKDKLVPANYQEKRSSDIPVYNDPTEHVQVKVLAGSFRGVQSDVFTLTPTELLDVTLGPRTFFQHKVPSSWNACFYVVTGSLVAGSQPVDAGSVGVFEKDGDDDGVEVQSGENGCRFVLLAGQPLHEPVVQYGPIVMNTRQEIIQAFADYEAGKF